jgi:carbonic anhydrase/acetyltransferase-like protein (isoleucine patch superfamily)
VTEFDRKPWIEPYDGEWPTIAPSAWVHASAVVIGKVTLGERVSIWPQATLRGDENRITIGDDSNIQDGSVVHTTGGVSETVIGKRVTVGHKCILHGCRVGDFVLVGMGAVIMDNAEIGEGSYIGAGTLIAPGKVIPPRSFAYGNPVRVIREVGDRERGWIDHGWRHYVEQAAKYRAR